MPEVRWEVGYEGDGLRVGFWVFLVPFLAEIVVARDVFRCKVAPEKVRRIGIRG